MELQFRSVSGLQYTAQAYFYLAKQNLITLVMIIKGDFYNIFLLRQIPNMHLRAYQGFIFYLMLIVTVLSCHYFSKPHFNGLAVRFGLLRSNRKGENFLGLQYVFLQFRILYTLHLVAFYSAVQDNYALAGFQPTLPRACLAGKIHRPVKPTKGT